MFWLLVTGTGRCGTGYAAHVLTSAGVRCTHEGLFKPRPWPVTAQEIKARRDNPAWGWQAESSWLAFPFLKAANVRELVVVHQVRHPKHVIDSKCRMEFWNYRSGKYRLYANWARSYLPRLDLYDTIQDKAAHWYIEVNRIVAESADVFHRAEDGGAALLDKLEIEYEPGTLYNNTRYNSRAGFVPSDVKLGDFSRELRLELERLSSRWGYDWP